MNLNNNEIEKNPPKKEIKFILELFNLNKIIEAENEANKQIIKYPKSSILYNIMGAISAGKNNLHEAKLLKLDSSKIFNLMKWKPTYSYDDSIGKTVDWYLRYHENKKTIQNFTILQIEDYVKQAQKTKNRWIK